MRWRRIAAVTAGLMAAGAVFGTITGVVVMLAWGGLIGGFGGFSVRDGVFLVQLSMVFGGLPGAVLGPLAAWGLMRHVPLGLAVGGTTAGTLAGGGLALIVSGDPFVALFWGMGGFAATAIGLRLRVPRERRLTSG